MNKLEMFEYLLFSLVEEGSITFYNDEECEEMEVKSTCIIKSQGVFIDLIPITYTESNDETDGQEDPLLLDYCPKVECAGGCQE